MDPFVWDEAKNAENLARRGLSFSLVYEMDWDAVRYDDDIRFDYGERRVRAFGRINGKPYCVVIAPRDGTIRVITVRRMHEKEAQHYDI